MLDWDDAELARKIREWAMRARPNAAALRRVCAEFELTELADELLAERAAEQPELETSA